MLKVGCYSHSVQHPRQAARRAKLIYVSDQSPGLGRRRRGRSFTYHRPDGKVIRDAATLKRIAALVIPPAWRDVWICANPRGHLQATGRDERGRKQFRYHPDWHAVRDSAKFDKMLDFADALPSIRRAIRRDLKRPGLPREKVLAAVVSLLEKTLIRVGNEQYARDNKHYGLTTLRDRHVRIKRGGKAAFSFTAKSGVKRAIDLEDQRLVRIIKRCQELPGEDLFQYVDESGKVVDVRSGDVNEYLRSVGGENFTAKDFRTFAGSVQAAELLKQSGSAESKAQAKRQVAAVVKQVAAALGNTQAVCRKCYIHPRVLTMYEAGQLDAASMKTPKRRPGLSASESMLVNLLSKVK